MAASGGVFNPFGLGALRNAVNNTTKILREKLTTVTRPSGTELQVAPAPVRPSGSRSQPIHPNAVFRQQRRLFSGWSQANINTVVRRFLSTLSDKQAAQGPRFDRSKFPVSNTSRLVAAFPGRAPFAHTLRPNLTGGALPRSAGGYGVTGGGARYFSHSPAAPAQVVQNVSQAMRAFFLSGQRVRFDGLDEHGQRKYRAVSVLEDEAYQKMAAVPRSHPGSFVDFHLSPTITAMSPLAAAFPFPASTETSDPEFYPTVYGYAAQTQKKQLIASASPTTLNTAGFLEELSMDFARALKDLTVTLQDIRRLSTLGDLSVELVPDAKVPTLRVRFPGVDAETVESLCDDVGVTRGIVGQDADFDASAGVPVALKFPFAPGCDGETKSLTSPGGSLRSLEGHELEEDFSDVDEAEIAFMIDELTERELAQENPWLSSPEPGYGTMSPCSIHSGDSFEGLEGIYRFIEECDRARDQLR